MRAKADFSSPLPFLRGGLGFSGVYRGGASRRICRASPKGVQERQNIEESHEEG